MSKKIYTYKFKLQPTKLQTILLNKHLGACRFVYNYFLDLKNKHYQTAREEDLEKKNLSYTDTTKLLTQLKKEEKYWWLKEINSQVLQQSLKNLDGAYNNFFKGVAQFPTFHSKYHKQGFRVPQSIEVKGNRIFIPKFKEGIKFISHRKLDYTKICNITITKDSIEKYYVSITVEKDIQDKPSTGLAVGVDIGIKSLAVCSDGTVINNPKNTNKYADKLKKVQRVLSRKLDKADKEQVLNKDGSPKYTKTGKLKFCLKQSKNSRKARMKIARLHAKIKNKRKDTIHKATKKIVDKNDIICIEDLNTKGMVRNRKLSKAVSDASFGEIKRQLEYKAKLYGKKIIKISRWYPSSKTCSECGWINQSLTLSERRFKCSQCACNLDRDLNASINILKQGLNLGNIKYKLKTVGTTELACGASTDGVLALVDTSYDAVKQEAPSL